jgi:hypothetical protein
MIGGLNTVKNAAFLEKLQFLCIKSELLMKSIVSHALLNAKSANGLSDGFLG